jgi:hypothetical protein
MTLPSVLEDITTLQQEHHFPSASEAALIALSNAVVHFFLPFAVAV